MKNFRNLNLLLSNLEKQYHDLSRYIGRVRLLQSIFSKNYGGKSKSWDECLDDALNTLPEREKTILKMRYNIDGNKFMTLEEVGKEFGVTRERIREIEQKAIRKLRHPLRKKIFAILENKKFLVS